MKSAILGRVVDVFNNEFEAKDGKTVKYSVLSLIDEDAFMDGDRIFTVRCSDTNIVKGVEIGKTYKIEGNLSTDRGVLKFKAKAITEGK